MKRTQDDNEHSPEQVEGLRDTFALQVMTAIVASIDFRDETLALTPEQLADMAYTYADALLERRGRRVTEGIAK